MPSLHRASTVAWLCACLLAAPVAPAPAVDGGGYRRPPDDIVALLSAPKPPHIVVAPGGARAVLVQPQVFARIEDLARPSVSLSGRRLDPRSHARRGMLHYAGLELLDLDSGETRALSVGGAAGIGYPQWSPGGDGLAFPLFTATGVELWHARVDDAAAARLADARLNPAGGRSFVWMPDGRRILCRLVPGAAGELPSVPAPGPVVMEAPGAWRAAGERSAARGDAYELALFDYFMRSQLAVADTASGALEMLGEPGLYGDFSPSPDGRFILVSRVTPPVAARGPLEAPPPYELWHADGSEAHAPSMSPAAGAALRRAIGWRHTAPATLAWIERGRQGSGERVMLSAAPFRDEPREAFAGAAAVTGIEWLDESDLAVVHEYDAATRRETAWLVDLADDGAAPKRMWRRHIDDRFGDPGRPIITRNAAGLEVVAYANGSIYMSGRGATPNGERPFLSRWPLAAMRPEIVWRSSEGSYESPVALLGDELDRLLIRYESSQSPPNYALEPIGGGGRAQLTRFDVSAVEDFHVTEEIVTFTRADGIALQATLYLPGDRAEGERLPLVLWAYPRTYHDARNASQVSRSGDRFSAFDRAVPAFLAMRGFAVMDQVSMPILRGEGSANATFAEQIVASASAAIDKAVAMGVADADRVGVAGHSFGAFMTVTLLARSHLFKAGVALSGAYNRTLTPFGFQTEQRTLWEAPGMYLEMSPFMYAHRIEAPLLLIHGGEDDNAGTSPMQSEILFRAITGHGGTAKLVVLPYEGHVYRARESVLHSAAEMLEWFSLHLGRRSRTANSPSASTSG